MGRVQRGMQAQERLRNDHPQQHHCTPASHGVHYTDTNTRTFTFTLDEAWIFSANKSHMGANRRQWPHHGAMNFTITFEFLISASKLSSWHVTAKESYTHTDDDKEDHWTLLGNQHA
jgi:hypothetical protein